MIDLVLCLDKRQEQITFNDVLELYNFLTRQFFDDKESYFLFSNIDKGTDFDENPVVILRKGSSLCSYINCLTETTNYDLFDNETQTLYIYRFDGIDDLRCFLDTAYN